jgi:hypothetical protein
VQKAPAAVCEKSIIRTPLKIPIFLSPSSFLLALKYFKASVFLCQSKVAAGSQPVLRDSSNIMSKKQIGSDFFFHFNNI